MKKICKILLVLMILIIPLMSGCNTNDWRECYAINIVTSNAERSYNSFFREFDEQYDNYIVKDNNYKEVYVKFEKGLIMVKCITFTEKVFEIEFIEKQCLYQVRWK